MTNPDTPSKVDLLSAVEAGGDLSLSASNKADVLDVKKRRKRRTKLEMQEMAELPKLSQETIHVVSNALFLVLKATTKLPFDAVKPELKESFDISLTQVANMYLPETYAKYVPLMQLGVVAALIGIDAYEIKYKVDKKQAKEEKASENEK